MLMKQLEVQQIRLPCGSFDEAEQYKPVFDRRFSMLQ
jgi:hypothetical protein